MPAEIDVIEQRAAHRIRVADLPTRYYPPATLHGDTLPAGVWTDHSDIDVQAHIYMLRNLQGDARLTHEQITSVLGLRHWRDSYNGARNIGRRRDGDNGRNLAGDLTWRRWNRPRNMRVTPAAPARPGSRLDGSLVARRFGVEIEFDRGTGGYDQRENIVRDCVAAGIRAEIENYNHNTRAHWKMTTDATVSGGEFVSPILAGDTASLDEMRDVIRIVRSHGGVATATVGMHVHHDVSDFVTPESRQALVDTLQNVQHAMSRFVLPARINGGSSHAGHLLTDGEFDRIRTNVRNIVPGANPGTYNDSANTVSRYRFFNVEGPMNKYGTVEFRALGATLHAGKVRVWVRVGQAVIEAARQGVLFNRGCSPRELCDTLTAANLLGPRTADKFVAECTRRYPV